MSKKRLTHEVIERTYESDAPDEDLDEADDGDEGCDEDDADDE